MNSEINLNTQLFIQGYDITHKDLSHICDLVMSLQYEKIDDYSWRIHQPHMTQDTKAAVQNYCNRSHIDLAYLPTRQSLHDFKLLAMDMDSTLITIECIDELALLAGVGEQVKAITTAAMRGEIRDFSDSLRRRVALLAGQPASLLQQVYDEKVKLSQGAQTLIDVAKAVGMKTLVVSGGFDFFTDRLQATLGLDDSHSNQLEIIDGKLN
jgi:phosphoserine phosphatase